MVAAVVCELVCTMNVPPQTRLKLLSAVYAMRAHHPRSKAKCTKQSTLLVGKVFGIVLYYVSR